MLTDGKGRIVDFKNTIIIMTLNVGSEHLIAGMSAETTMETARGLLMKQKHYRPELLNRLSAIVVFEPLSRDNLKEVVTIQMKSVITRVADKGICLCASDDALDIILSESYNPMYSARPIRRWVQENVTTMISKMMVKGEASPGSTICVDATDDKKGLKYEVVDRVTGLPSHSGDDSDDLLMAHYEWQQACKHEASEG